MDAILGRPTQLRRRRQCGLPRPGRAAPATAAGLSHHQRKALPLIYDKRHLFSLAGEHHHFKAGEERIEVEFRGFRILLQVCYDLRFPVFTRNDRETPYDLALYVANWPETRSSAWRTLLQARAIENQCFVVGINRAGTDGNGHRYAGDSLIADFAGSLLADTGSDGLPKTLQAAISHEDLQAFRTKLPFLKDADSRKG